MEICRLNPMTVAIPKDLLRTLAAGALAQHLATTPPAEDLEDWQIKRWSLQDFQDWIERQGETIDVELYPTTMDALLPPIFGVAS